MANKSIFDAFERMWQHTVAKLGLKADKAEIQETYETKAAADDKLAEAKEYAANEVNALAGQVVYIDVEDNEDVTNPDIESNSVVIDSALSTTSVNPVQNKVVTNAINALSDTINDQQTELDEYQSLTLGVHTDGLIYLFKNGVPKGNGLEIKAEEVTGDVIGTIDENNNILLSGALTDGTYTLKYLNEDGTYTDVGSLVVGAVEPEPEEPESPKGNLADPTSADWLTDNRLATGYGYGKTLSGYTFTNYIPAKIGDVLRVKGLNLFGVSGSNHSAIGLYSSTDTAADSTGKINAYLGFRATSIVAGSSADGVKGDISVDGDVYTYTVALRNGVIDNDAFNATQYIRISAPLASGYTKNDVVITVNEEIV